MVCSCFKFSNGCVSSGCSLAGWLGLFVACAVPTIARLQLRRFQMRQRRDGLSKILEHLMQRSLQRLDSCFQRFHVTTKREARKQEAEEKQNAASNNNGGYFPIWK